MTFDQIISIPGMGGLFKMVAQMRNGGFVVEGLTDGKRFPVSAMQRIIMLKDISVYTMEEDMPLHDVFKKMKEQDDVASKADPKADPEKLKSSLKKILPEFDEERVHASDIRKMFQWYGQLKDIIGNEEISDEKVVDENPSEVKDESTQAEKPEGKPAAKKTARKKKVTEDTGEEEIKAPKKRAAKKTTGKED